MAHNLIGILAPWHIGTLAIILSLTSCGSNKGGDSSVEEDLTAKSLLQGVWLDDETEMPLVRIVGDTIYYTDPQSAPAAFHILQDTIYIHSLEPIPYKIDRQTEYEFWFHSLADDVVRMHKSENDEDSLAFLGREVQVISTTAEVVKKDSVVLYDGTRYRGYVAINPSRMRVLKPTYSDSGISVDNVYYDNVIHICVYEGRNQLFGQDISKRMFADIFPADWLEQTILADMDFTGVDAAGYHFQALLGIPESSVYNLVGITVGFDNHLSMAMVE